MGRPGLIFLKDLREALGQRTLWYRAFIGTALMPIFVAFTQSSTFGPTDAPLLARWAKVLAMIQVFISLSIVILLISRAVGVL